MCTNSEIEFSIKILKALSLNKTSTVFSPFMILKDLIAISSGFDDADIEELVNVFDKVTITEILKPEKAEHYSTIIKMLKDINNDKSASKILFSSSMFSSKDRIFPSDVNLMQKLEINYHLINFSDVKNSAEKINNIISYDTENHITEIVSDKNINSEEEEANMIISNGIYFFGEWETLFEHYFDCLWLSHENVHLRRNQRLMARTNYGDKVWNLTEGDNWKCLGIPFKRRKLWLHIILPKKRLGLAPILKEFDADLLRKCIVKKYGILAKIKCRDGPSKEINVNIPIFNMTNKFSLMEILSKLKIDNISKNISISQMFDKSAKFDDIFHASRIDIDQINLPEMVYSNEMVETSFHRIEDSFSASQPFIYFVTLVDKDVDDLKTILLLGTFY